MWALDKQTMKVLCSDCGGCSSLKKPFRERLDNLTGFSAGLSLSGIQLFDKTEKEQNGMGLSRSLSLSYDEKWVCG